MNANEKKQKIVFGPVSPLISAILKKYGLGETDKEIFEKYLKGEKSYSEKVAVLLYEAAENNFSLETLTLELQKRLNIPLQYAKAMALEFKNRVLIFAKKVPLEAPEEKLKPTTMVKPAPKEFRERPSRAEVLKEEGLEKEKVQDIYKELPKEEGAPETAGSEKLKRKTKDVYKEPIE